MNPTLLIDLIVSQLTVLIAQLATRSGMRPPLARVADEMFQSLVAELQVQGVPQRVIADMFGLALRGYQTRVRRLEQREEEEQLTLSMNLLRAIQTLSPISRDVLELQFASVDEATRRSTLRDLVDSGRVKIEGSRANPTYVAVSQSEPTSSSREQRLYALRDMIAVWLYRNGPADTNTLALRLKDEPDRVLDALELLMDDGSVQSSPGPDGTMLFRAETYLVAGAEDSGAGWEAAIYDHVQAMSATIIQSLRLEAGDVRRQQVGGGTYSFDVWEGHPYFSEVLELLAANRKAASALREKVQKFNDENGLSSNVTRSTFYCGQFVVEGYSEE